MADAPQDEDFGKELAAGFAAGEGGRDRKEGLAQLFGNGARLDRHLRGVGGTRRAIREAASAPGG